MSTVDKLKIVIDEGLVVKSSLLDEEEIEEISNKLDELSNYEKPKGYTIPTLDTIGANLRCLASSELELK